MTAVPLWRQLQATAQIVALTFRGASSSLFLEQLPPDLRPGVQALAYTVWRNLGRAQALRGALSARAGLNDADALLCTALALGWDPATAPYDAHTLVNQTVEAAKRHVRLRHQAGYLNACLRRFEREREALVAQTDANPLARWNYPPWWVRRLQHDWPDRWEAIVRAGNVHPPMSLRVNRCKTSVADYLERLHRAGRIARVLEGEAIVLERPCPVTELPGFAQGLVSVQDAAAQRAVPLLRTGESVTGVPRILDACAAPGGKTAHLLEWGAAQVTALDIDAQRCRRIADNLNRLGLQARVLAADALQATAWWDGEPFDAILLDAPCTASGIVRRHPDIRWLRRPDDIEQLARTQAALLQALWPMLRPGGRLLYCTCSVFRQEGALQTQAFLAHHTDARLLAEPGHLLPSGGAGGQLVLDNAGGEHDGFYYALLDKH